jgi:hypothetical protein
MVEKYVMDVKNAVNQIPKKEKKQLFYAVKRVVNSNGRLKIIIVINIKFV